MLQAQSTPNACFHQSDVRKYLRSVPSIRDSSVDGSAIFTSSIIRSIGPSVGATIDQIDNLTLSEVGGLNELATPWYSDQILPFDITLAGSNEYGAQAASKIFGVEILNEGSGISIDDAVSEMQDAKTRYLPVARLRAPSWIRCRIRALAAHRKQSSCGLAAPPMLPVGVLRSRLNSDVFGGGCRLWDNDD